METQNILGRVEVKPLKEELPVEQKKSMQFPS